MSKKLRRAAKALAGIGAAYLGSKMLGSKMDQMDRARGIGTSMDTDTEFKGGKDAVSRLTKKGKKRLTEKQFDAKLRGAGFGTSGDTDIDPGKNVMARTKKGVFYKPGTYGKRPSLREATDYQAEMVKSMRGFSKGSGKNAVTVKTKLGRTKPTKLY